MTETTREIHDKYQIRKSKKGRRNAPSFFITVLSHHKPAESSSARVFPFRLRFTAPPNKHHAKINKEVKSQRTVVVPCSIGNERGAPNNHSATNSETRTPNSHVTNFTPRYCFVVTRPSNNEYIETSIAEADSKTISTPSTANLVAKTGNK